MPSFQFRPSLIHCRVLYKGLKETEILEKLNWKPISPDLPHIKKHQFYIERTRYVPHYCLWVLSHKFTPDYLKLIVIVEYRKKSFKAYKETFPLKSQKNGVILNFWYRSQKGPFCKAPLLWWPKNKKKMGKDEASMFFWCGVVINVANDWLIWDNGVSYYYFVEGGTV